MVFLIVKDTSISYELTKLQASLINITSPTNVDFVVDIPFECFKNTGDLKVVLPFIILYLRHQNGVEYDDFSEIPVLTKKFSLFVNGNSWLTRFMTLSKYSNIYNKNFDADYTSCFKESKYTDLEDFTIGKNMSEQAVRYDLCMVAVYFGISSLIEITSTALAYHVLPYKYRSACQKRRAYIMSNKLSDEEAVIQFQQYQPSPYEEADRMMDVPVSTRQPDESLNARSEKKDKMYN